MDERTEGQKTDMTNSICPGHIHGRAYKCWYPWKGLVAMSTGTHLRYQSTSTYHSKVIAKVNVSDRMTDRTKTICPLIFDHGGIKIQKMDRQGRHDRHPR
jgi:hypothetical protein